MPAPQYTGITGGAVAPATVNVRATMTVSRC